MKLNNSHKQAFVAALMQDIPSVDYVDDFRSYIMKEGLATLPKEVLAIHANPKTVDYLERSQKYFPGIGYVYFCARFGWKPESDENIKLVLDETALKNQDQSKQRSKIKEKLEGVIASCSTLKQAETLLPEFIKYLPTNTGSAIDRSMPVITDLVVTLTAAGWPKDAKPQQEVAEQLAA